MTPNHVRVIHQVVYGLSAAGMVAIGSAGFLLPYGLLPDMAERFDTETLHIIQEACSAIIALGMLAAWCALRYDRCQPAHTILTVFFVLIAALHWIDYFRASRHIWSGVNTSVPVIGFLLLSYLRRRYGSANTDAR